MPWRAPATTGVRCVGTLAIQWPDAPLSQPILWLIRIAGPDASVPVYSLTMLVLILIVYTGHTLFDYLTKHPRRRGE